MEMLKLHEHSNKLAGIYEIKMMMMMMIFIIIINSSNIFNLV